MRLTLCLVTGFLVCASVLAQPIEDALRAEHPDLAQLAAAIKEDANPGHRTRRGASYLHLAVRRNLGDHIHVLMKVPAIEKLLLWRNKDGFSAIEEAIMKNRFDAFKALLSYFVHVDGYKMHNKYRWSLMHLAAAYGRVDMIVELYNAGHELYGRDKDGWTPLDLAHAKQQWGAVRKLGELLHSRNPPVAEAPQEEQDVPAEPKLVGVEDGEQIGAAPFLQQTEAGIKPFVVSAIFAGCIWVACHRFF